MLASQRARPSNAVSNTFYVYRAQSDVDYPFENVNAADALGVLLYIHHETLGQSCPRKFDVTRILRYRVTTYRTAAERCHQPFTHFSAFDYGKGPEQVNDNSVGCEAPGSNWYQHAYVGATYYSFPGRCKHRDISGKDEQCMQRDPGGSCDSPDGSASCTWRADPIGELRIAELSGIKTKAQEDAMCRRSGNWEMYRVQQNAQANDMPCFWDHPDNEEVNHERAAQLDYLFRIKYPDIAGDILGPACAYGGGSGGDGTDACDPAPAQGVTPGCSTWCNQWTTEHPDCTACP